MWNRVCMDIKITRVTGVGEMSEGMSMRSCWYRLDRKCLCCAVQGMAVGGVGWSKCRKMVEGS